MNPPPRRPAIDGYDAVIFPTRDLVIAALAAALCVAGAQTWMLEGLWDWAEPVAIRINWALVPVIGVLATVHFLASAISVRAVAGRRLSVWEVMSAQFAGSAANRLTPAGLGSAAVNCRYLTRRGLGYPEAATAIATVGAARAVTKLALLALAAWYAPAGWHPPALPGLVGHPSAPLTAVCVAAVTALTAAMVWRYVVRRSPLPPGGRPHLYCPASGQGTEKRTRFCGKLGHRSRAAAGEVVVSLRRIARRPRDLLVSLASATVAHCALSLAFVMSVLAVPGARTQALGVLAAVYLLGATAGAAVPTPAGVGPTEAALIATLTAAHEPAGAAAQGVLLFRIMTFWAPVPVGVLASRWLRGRGGL